MRLLTLLCWAAVVAAGDAVPAKPAGLIRIGDAGTAPDPSLYDERFPEMAEWAAAGVEGGIPEVERIVGTVKPGEDLAAAIAAADVAQGRLGVLLVQPGTYTLASTLKLKTGLILRGADRDKTILSSTLPTGVCFVPVAWSAFEDLTLQNQLVKDRPESEYIGIYKNGGPSDACTVHFSGSNSWMQRVNVLFSGKNPIEVHDGRVSHVTIRDCLVDKAFNKGGQGAGYFDISESTHVLVYNTTVRNIRHISIMFNARYAVLYGCRVEVDINYHDGCPKHILVEKTTVSRRDGHHWSPICYGWEPWQDDGPGPRCFLWNNSLEGVADGVRNVFVLRDTTPKYKQMPEKEPMILDFGPPPKGGTLYAVNARDIPLEDMQKGKMYDRLLQAAKAGNQAAVAQLAATVQRMYKPDEPQAQKAAALATAADQAAAAALAKLKDKATPAALRQFKTAFEGTAPAAEANAIAADAAKAAWSKLGAAPSPSALRQFVSDWQGLAPIDDAQASYEAQAQADYDKRKDRLTTPATVKSFQQQWPGTKAAAAAEAALVAKLRAALADLVARKAKMTKAERDGYAAQFAGTPLEAEAKKALADK